jgi:hypothetical protein
MSWQSKFDYDDVVRVRDDGPQEARPGAKAWIVGVEVARQGTYYTKFLPGVVYTIEFEDGAAVDVHESHLELFPGVEVRPVKR